MPLPKHRQRRLAQQVTARLPPRNFMVVRAGSEPLSVRAYLKRRVASDYDAEQGFIPTTATILTPLDEAPLREGDELGGYVVTQTLDSAGWLAYAAARLPAFDNGTRWS